MSKIQFLDLGWQPIANGFLENENLEKEYFYSLRVALDAETNLFTQMECVKPDLMFLFPSIIEEYSLLKILISIFF